MQAYELFAVERMGHSLPHTNIVEWRLSGVHGKKEGSRAIDEVRLGGRVSAARYDTSHHGDNELGFQLGQRVSHRIFGEGVILHLEGHGEHSRVQVNFENEGVKWLVAAYAGLEAV